MRGFPYKYDKEIIFTYANSRTPGCYGWYSSMKQCCPVGSPYVTYDEPWQAFGMNEIVLRYADIMLIRAEALIELNENLEEARTLINEIRTRAKNSMARIDYAEDFAKFRPIPRAAGRRNTPGRPCASSVVWSWQWSTSDSSTWSAGVRQPTC